MARWWTCQGCGSRNPRVKKKCPTSGCKRTRPALRRPAHMDALQIPYEVWAERYGESCGICGRSPSPTRRLDRDHDHSTGEPRGLLCHSCNRLLRNGVTVAWLQNAIRYLERVGEPTS